MPLLRRSLAALCLAATAASCHAASITLRVDVRDAPRGLFHATETIPARPGPLTLLYPQWLPGEHSSIETVNNLVGLRITAMGQPLPWRRDPVDLAAFHCDVPAGATGVDVALDYLLPTSGSFTSGQSATEDLAVLNWNQVLLYPAGGKAEDFTFSPHLQYPAEWKVFSALPPGQAAAGRADYPDVPLTELVDSPVQMGRHTRSIVLSETPVPVHLDIVADDEDALKVPDEAISHYRRLVTEANAMFGAYHYRHYDFLWTLSDRTSHFGLEHHESSDDRSGKNAASTPANILRSGNLLPHEYVHSWNGKFRRPAGLATPDYQTPMETDLLWVYEGLTEYLGQVLAARCGLWTPAHYRHELATSAARLDREPGRTWRSLADTAVAAPALYGAATGFPTYRRGTDFYAEGALLWLDVDVTIRQMTKGRKSLDDFCRLFYGGPSGQPDLKTYTLDDVVAALNTVVPSDWRAFLNTRLQSLGPSAPLGGIVNGGWRVTYDDTPGEPPEPNEAARTGAAGVSAADTLGFSTDSDGDVSSVEINSPAWKAGLSTGMRVLAVNDTQWSRESVKDALKASEKSTQPLNLLVRSGDHYRTMQVDYHGGLRYAHLERNAAVPDYLDDILKPLAAAAPAKSAAPARGLPAASSVVPATP